MEEKSEYFSIRIDADISMEMDRQPEEQESSSIDNLIAAPSVEPSNASRTGQEVPLSSTANPSSNVDQDSVGVQNQQKNEWVYIKSGKKYFRRRQTRTESDASGTERGIDLEQLRRISSKNEPFWYHATSWENALKIIENGPECRGGKHDCLNCPAFYLNPNFLDAYEWLSKKDERFGGKHAIMIYQFLYDNLPGSGKVLTKIQHKETSRKRESDFDWIFTFQNSNPTSKQSKIRRTSEGDDAKQLIVCTRRVCRYIDKNLIACVFYDELNHISSCRATNNDDSEDQTEEEINNSMECE